MPSSTAHSNPHPNPNPNPQADPQPRSNTTTTSSSSMIFSRDANPNPNSNVDLLPTVFNLPTIPSLSSTVSGLAFIQDPDQDRNSGSSTSTSAGTSAGPMPGESGGGGGRDELEVHRRRRGSGRAGEEVEGPRSVEPFWNFVGLEARSTVPSSLPWGEGGAGGGGRNGVLRMSDTYWSSEDEDDDEENDDDDDDAMEVEVEVDSGLRPAPFLGVRRGESEGDEGDEIILDGPLMRTGFEVPSVLSITPSETDGVTLGLGEEVSRRSIPFGREPGGYGSEGSRLSSEGEVVLGAELLTNLASSSPNLPDLPSSPSSSVPMEIFTQPPPPTLNDPDAPTPTSLHPKPEDNVVVVLTSDSRSTSRIGGPTTRTSSSSLERETDHQEEFTSPSSWLKQGMVFTGRQMYERPAVTNPIRDEQQPLPQQPQVSVTSRTRLEDLLHHPPGPGSRPLAPFVHLPNPAAYVGRGIGSGVGSGSGIGNGTGAGTGSRRSLDLTWPWAPSIPSSSSSSSTTTRLRLLPNPPPYFPILPPASSPSSSSSSPSNPSLPALVSSLRRGRDVSSSVTPPNQTAAAEGNTRRSDLPPPTWRRRTLEDPSDPYYPHPLLPSSEWLAQSLRASSRNNATARQSTPSLTLSTPTPPSTNRSRNPTQNQNQVHSAFDPLNLPYASADLYPPYHRDRDTDSDPNNLPPSSSSSWDASERILLRDNLRALRERRQNAIARINELRVNGAGVPGSSSVSGAGTRAGTGLNATAGTRGGRDERVGGVRRVYAPPFGAENGKLACPEEWTVTVTITSVDLHKGTLSGLMQALNVPGSVDKVITCFDGEIVDLENHSLSTGGKWNASKEVDLEYWRKTRAFSECFRDRDRDGHEGAGARVEGRGVERTGGIGGGPGLGEGWNGWDEVDWGSSVYRPRWSGDDGGLGSTTDSIRASLQRKRKEWEMDLEMDGEFDDDESLKRGCGGRERDGDGDGERCGKDEGGVGVGRVREKMGRRKKPGWWEELSRDWVLMRWKESSFVNVEPQNSGLTIQGFYYVCLERSTGHIEGWYHDRDSNKYQRLALDPACQGQGIASGTFELR